MKFSGIIPRAESIPASLALTVLLLSHTFANSIIVGGYVPERRSLTITPTYGAGITAPDQAAEVAVIEIDNNLPNYQLVLDFSEQDGSGDLISEVRLQGLGGTLGQGLAVPTETALNPGAHPGQFIWTPGRQETATTKYRVRVMVTYKRPPAEQPLMMVSMPFAY